MRIVKPVVGLAVAASLVLGLGSVPAAANPAVPAPVVATVDPAAGLPVVEEIVDPELEDVAIFYAEPGEASVTAVEDPDGVVGTAEVELDSTGFAPIAVTAEIDGEAVSEEFVVEDFLPVGDDDFVAQLRVASTGEIVRIDTTAVEQQAVPVLIILGALARLGLKHAIRWYGKTQVKKAVKSYLLNNLNAQKWGHIMAPKHNWTAVNARSREQVAELMARAMSEGSHSAYKNSGTAMVATWRYAGRIIDVTYSKASGHVSNGWVR